MCADDLPHTDERAPSGTTLSDLRIDLSRTLEALLQDGEISGFDLLVMTLWADGWSYQEIASELDCSKGLAHKCVARVEDAIRESGLMRGYE